MNLVLDNLYSDKATLRDCALPKDEPINNSTAEIVLRLSNVEELSFHLVKWSNLLTLILPQSQLAVPSNQKPTSQLISSTIDLMPNFSIDANGEPLPTGVFTPGLCILSFSYFRPQDHTSRAFSSLIYELAGFENVSEA
ncbi:hypothetical protein BT96DRAFT_918775 [Gymnopus androsaceus JB14]|uniref:Uncharacterized protein n=1 Tax=Gymnopus androsaceus JB14 TaxID=1447944 RepID=A0A6A4HWZ8_9AGAR|nr:hypothetical protein BT96DRAFT_918775 [Gymnopus androsaceus JB14]